MLGCPCEGFAPGPGTRIVEERGVPLLEEGKSAEKERDGAGGSSHTDLVFLPLLTLFSSGEEARGELQAPAMAPHPPALPAPPRPPRRTVVRLPTTATPIAAVQIYHSVERRRNPSPSSPPVQRAPPFNPQCRPYAGRLLRPKHQFVFDNASPSSVLTAIVLPPPVTSSSMRRLNLVR
ncbi:hypothetical protein U1Q18_037672 [Sarracenia purpurea var. burkii]